MKLESIVETYGKRADYYDMHTGYTYACNSQYAELVNRTQSLKNGSGMHLFFVSVGLDVILEIFPV